MPFDVINKIWNRSQYATCSIDEACIIYPELDRTRVRSSGVMTKVLNQAAMRNTERFREDFAYQPSSIEAGNLRSQIMISRLQGVEAIPKNRNRSQSVTGSYDKRRLLTSASTEHGVLITAHILRSEQARQMDALVIRTYARAGDRNHRSP
jgi:ORF6N domain